MGVLFVNKKVLVDDYPAILKIDGNKAKICITDLGEKYLEDRKSKSEIIEFEFPFDSYTNYQREYNTISSYQKKNLTISFSEMLDKGDKFIFEGDSHDEITEVYALLCPRQTFSPGEIYILVEDCDKVTVIKKFNFCSYNIEREMSMDRMYFVKIELPKDKPINIYLSTEKTDCLQEQIVLSRTSFLPSLVKDCNTYIRLDEKDNKKLVALSDFITS